MRQWTNEEIEYLKQNYPYKPIQELCEHLEFNRQRIHDKANKLQIKKVKFFTTTSEKSKATQFKKGMTSWNKGMKGLHLSPGTEFKAGQVPHNKLPEELREVALLRRQLTKNINERLKRYENKTNDNRVVIK
jgi:hypothetical protein